MNNLILYELTIEENIHNLETATLIETTLETALETLLEYEYEYEYTNLINPNNYLENFIMRTLNSPNPHKNVLSDEGKTQLKKIKYNNDNDNKYNISCPITMIDFEDNQDVILLPCNHCFIPEAIEKWLQEEKAECPICRFKLKETTISNSNSNITEENFDLWLL